MDLPAAKKNLAAFKHKLAGRPSRLTKSVKRQAGGTPVQLKILEISALDGNGLDRLKLALRKALT
jgi:hypothetical protein